MKAAEYRQQTARAMRERDFGHQVEALASTLGLLYFHTFRSEHSAPGFPDYVIVGKKVLYRELKRTTGRVTPAQQHWLDRLAAAGQNATVWRPEDLLSGRILREMREAA